MLARLIFGLFILLVMMATYYGGKSVIDPAGLKPDNPLYFLDTLTEQVDLWGAKDKEDKIKKLIDLVEEKISEASALLERGDSDFAQRALDSGDKYTQDAIDFINSLKLDGANSTSTAQPSSLEDLAQKLGEAVLKKQEIFADIYSNAPASAKTFIESQIKSTGSEVKSVMNSIDGLNAQTSEKITSKIEQTEELVDDKIEESKEQETKKDLEDLSKQEKQYNIWIDHFYAADEDGMTTVSAHIRRRDPQCSQFKGRFNLYINNTFYRSFDLMANGYDDIRKTFDKFFLEKGTYWMTGILTDVNGNKISNKQFKLIM